MDSVWPLVEAFSKVSNEDHRGTRLANEAHFPPERPPKTVILHPDIYDLLLRLINRTAAVDGCSPYTPDALELEKISISGVIYASEKSLPRDSNIIFQRPGGSSQRVGRIKLIFQVSYQPGTTFLVVSQYRLIANSDVRDVYRRFGFAGGFLCDADEDSRPLVIRSKDVVCHFAKITLDPKEEKLMHALPLNVVREFAHVTTFTDMRAENGGVPNPGGVLSPRMMSWAIHFICSLLLSCALSPVSNILFPPCTLGTRRR